MEYNVNPPTGNSTTNSEGTSSETDRSLGAVTNKTKKIDLRWWQPTWLWRALKLSFAHAWDKSYPADGVDLNPFEKENRVDWDLIEAKHNEHFIDKNRGKAVPRYLKAYRSHFATRFFSFIGFPVRLLDENESIQSPKNIGQNLVGWRVDSPWYVNTLRIPFMIALNLVIIWPIRFVLNVLKLFWALSLTSQVS